MDVLSFELARIFGGKPFEPFGKDSDQLKKAETRDDGPTGPATSKHQKG
jgi:hypothetical protein